MGTTSLANCRGVVDILTATRQADGQSHGGDTWARATSAPSAARRITAASARPVRIARPRKPLPLPQRWRRRRLTPLEDAPTEVSMSWIQPGSPGFFCRCGWLLLLATEVLTGCNPWNWRELQSADATWSATLPDKPQIESREIDAAGLPIRLTMTSAGVGATLFAIGEAALPASLAADPAERERLIVWLRDRLLANVSASDVVFVPVRVLPPSGRELRSLQALTARAVLSPRQQPVQLSARWFIVDDRLYQLVVMGAETDLPFGAADNFFTSFRLLAR
ncbi:MAG: hypothetical protein RR240_05100 [Burkholderiaceae bacterium]